MKEYSKIKKIIIPDIQDADNTEMINDLCNYLDAHDWDYVVVKEE